MQRKECAIGNLFSVVKQGKQSLRVCLLCVYTALFTVPGPQASHCMKGLRIVCLLDNCVICAYLSSHSSLYRPKSVGLTTWASAKSSSLPSDELLTVIYSVGMQVSLFSASLLAAGF